MIGKRGSRGIKSMRPIHQSWRLVNGVGVVVSATGGVFGIIIPKGAVKFVMVAMAISEVVGLPW